MGDLSANFNRAEFACKHCGSGGPTPQLIAIVQKLRNRVGRPLRIVSGCRCVPYNKTVGGALESRHVDGDAADIPEGYATVADAAACGAVGIGNKGPWAIHVDWRPGGPARWSY